jgi:ADP-heptose:LPS heptosyltransferase
LLRDIAPLLAREPHPAKQDMALTPSSPLPAAVLNRPKTGFGIPVRRWLLEEDRKFEITNQKLNERGLRSWTRLIYSAHVSGRADSLTLARAGVRHSPRRPARFATWRKILVFRIGQLGDTIAALPAMWTIRQQFPRAELTLLCDRHPDKQYVFGPDLLRGSGLFEKFEFYPVRNEMVAPFVRTRDMVALLARLRKEHYDALVYLSPSARSRLQILRDERFFRLAGIKEFIGTGGFSPPPTRVPGHTLAEVPHESEMLLARLAAADLPIPPVEQGCTALGLGATEEQAVRDWLGGLPPDGGRPWVAFGPGSKMPAKRWPAYRYAEVGNELIRRHDLWPVIFGGVEDAEGGDQLLAQWGRGYNAAGRLSLRGAAQALHRCLFYVGNDTGTMHLAAAAGIPCVAVFSARDWPGRWYPYGPGHHVLRACVECEGCGLIECVERRMECLTRITIGQVLAECQAVLGETARRQDDRTTDGGLQDYGLRDDGLRDNKTLRL